MAQARRVKARAVFGVVDGFDCKKHYGFIRYEGRTIYVNRKDITESGTDEQGRKYLKSNQMVNFDLCEGPRGFMACNVRVRADFPVHAQKIPRTPSTAEVVEKNACAVIVSVKVEKSFCIVKTNNEVYPTLLAHFSNFKQTPHKAPAIGTAVRCDVGRETGGKYVALRVRLEPSKLPNVTVDPVAIAGLRLLEKDVPGKVVSVKAERGFGIIETKDFGTLLCHYTSVTNSDGGLTNLQLRQKVTCDVAENKHKKTKVAINVVPGELPDLEEETQALDLAGADEARKEISEIEDELICHICFCLLENPVIFPCEHLFCWECIYKWLEYQRLCPVDRKRITLDDMKPAPRLVKNLLEKIAR